MPGRSRTAYTDRHVLPNHSADHQLAVVRAQLLPAGMAQRLPVLFDRAYAAVRKGDVVQSGQNVVVYREAAGSTWETQVGILVAVSYAAASDIVCSRRAP